MKTTLYFQPVDFPRANPNLEMALFRIIQEALTNVLRHASATNVAIQLELKSASISLRIMDDGRGMPSVQKISRESFGVGLSGMTQRAKDLGGELRILPGGPGTIIEVIVPFIKG